jgi:hypothetical protein
MPVRSKIGAVLCSIPHNKFSHASDLIVPSFTTGVGSISV